GLRLRPDLLDLDDDRGVPEPAARLGARARLVHDRAVQRARGLRLPRGHRAGRVRQRRAREGRARAALGRVQARDVQVRARRGVHRGAQDAEQAGTRLEGTGLGARRRGRAARRPGGGAAGPGDPRRPDARQDLRGHVRDRHRCGRRAALDLPLPRVRQRADDARVRRAGGRAADCAQPGRGARAAGRRGLERDGRARAGGLRRGAAPRPARRLRRGAQAARAGSERAPMLWPGLAFLAGGALLGLLLIHPGFDEAWENHPAHFWLVVSAAAVSVGLGYAVGVAARRRRDARLFLVSLAFISAAGFLGLHALATPGVLLGKNGGFELATPFGLAVAGLFAAASGLPLRPRGAEWVLRTARIWIGALAALLAAWAAVSLSEVPPLAGELGAEELNGWQITLALLGIVFYAVASFGYFRLYRMRRAQFLLGVALAFALLAEAMLVIAWARNWRASWWEWHVLMLIAFTAIAVSARGEWHEERFSPLYLDETLADTREATILFADLQGFTSFSERTAPARVATMLNGYFGKLVPLLERDGGVVHQIIGDAVMVIFNQHGDQPDHAVRAARTALAFQGAAAQIGPRALRGAAGAGFHGGGRRDRGARARLASLSRRCEQRRGAVGPGRRPERPPQ